jgi:hypothetical protein
VAQNQTNGAVAASVSLDPLPSAPETNQRGGLEQIHVWLRPSDARLLRTLASEREQTISGAVRYLLRPFRMRRLGK